MGRLGSHPHIVTVFDLGEHEAQPYMVTELMVGQGWWQKVSPASVGTIPRIGLHPWVPIKTGLFPGELGRGRHEPHRSLLP